MIKLKAKIYFLELNKYIKQCLRYNTGSRNNIDKRRTD